MKVHQPMIEDITPGMKALFASDSSVANYLFESLESDSLQAVRVDMRQVIMEKCSLFQANLEKLGLQDVRMSDCNLVAMNCSKGSWLRVELINCRMDGADSYSNQFKDVVFQGCKLDLANFRFANMQRVRFINCTLVETDFMNAVFDEVEFIGCIIDRTNFEKIKAKMVSLSGSEIISLQGWPSLKGVTIDRLQLIESAEQIALALGLKIALIPEN